MPEDRRGRFVWFDLATPDPEAAQRFYPAVVGWGTAPFVADWGSYTMWTREGRAEESLGGIQPMSAERAAGAPPHWLAYVSSPDTDATARRAAELGGKVMVAPQDIPTVGRFAVLADPWGAVIAAFTPSGGEQPTPAEPPLGAFSWHELASAGTPEEAFGFHSALFGWEKTGELDMGPDGLYLMYGVDGMPFGGMYTVPGRPGAWLHYVRVADVDRAAAAAREAGGTVDQEPMEVPGGNRIAQLRDPQGARFAVHQIT